MAKNGNRTCGLLIGRGFGLGAALGTVGSIVSLYPMAIVILAPDFGWRSIYMALVAPLFALLGGWVVGALIGAVIGATVGAAVALTGRLTRGRPAAAATHAMRCSALVVVGAYGIAATIIACWIPFENTSSAPLIAVPAVIALALQRPMTERIIASYFERTTPLVHRVGAWTTAPPPRMPRPCSLRPHTGVWT